MNKVKSNAASIVLVFVLATAAAVPARAQDHSTRIFSAASGPDKCMGVKEVDLRHPFMAPCAGYAAQFWMVGPPNKLGFVRFKSKRTGSDVCLGVAAANPSTLIMAPCASVKNQQWMLTPTAQPHTYTVTSQLSGPGVCLGIRSNTGNAELDMNACHNYPGQVWTITL